MLLVLLSGESYRTTHKVSNNNSNSPLVFTPVYLTRSSVSFIFKQNALVCINFNHLGIILYLIFTHVNK